MSESEDLNLRNAWKEMGIPLEGPFTSSPARSTFYKILANSTWVNLIS